MTVTRKEDWTLITGASQGIGKAMAVDCAMRNMNLFLVALPHSGLKELSEWLRENYPVRIEYLETDLTRDDSYKNLCRTLTYHPGNGDFPYQWESPDKDQEINIFNPGYTFKKYILRLFLQLFV